MSSSDLSPFDTIPDSAEAEERETAIRAKLAELIDIMAPAFEPGAPLGREDPRQQVAATIGTLMMRLAVEGLHLAGARTPLASDAQMKGDMALLCARTAGYIIREFSPVLKPHITKHLLVQLGEAAGFGEGREAPSIIRPN